MMHHIIIIAGARYNMHLQLPHNIIHACTDVEEIPDHVVIETILA